MNTRALLEALRHILDQLPDPGPAFDEQGEPVPNALDDAKQITRDLLQLTAAPGIVAQGRNTAPRPNAPHRATP